MGIFLPNPAFDSEFVKQPEVVEATASRGQDLANRAGELMPPGKSNARGHIAAKFKVEIVDSEVRVGNTDPFFHLAEFGSVNNPAYAPLRRAADELGLRFDEAPKP